MYIILIIVNLNIERLEFFSFSLQFELKRVHYIYYDINFWLDFSGTSNLVRVRAPLTTPSGLRILAPGTVTNTLGGTLVTPSITPTILSPTHTTTTQLQTTIASPVRGASPQTQTQGQAQSQSTASGQMSGIQALAAAAAATQKMSTGMPSLAVGCMKLHYVNFLILRLVVPNFMCIIN